MTQPVPLTAAQRRVFDRIVELTSGGKRPFYGRVAVPGTPGSTTNHYVVLFSMLGLVKLKKLGRSRRLELLVGPEGVQTVGDAEIMSLRMAGRLLKEDKRPRDEGRFSEAFEAAFGGRKYPSLKMKADLPFKGGARPDARVL